MKMCHRFWFLFWVFILSLIATGVYLLYFEPPFLSYRSLPFKIEGPVKPGKPIKMTVTRCNSSDRPQGYEVSRWFKCAGDDKPPVVLLGVKVPPIPPGCAVAISEVNITPEGTKPGWCRVGGFGVVSGTLRTIEVPWVSEWFEVIQ